MAKREVELRRQSNSDGVGKQASHVRVTEEHNIWLEPEKIERYEALLPGSAERIFRQVEREQEFRHRTMGSVVRTDNWTVIAGQLFAFVLIAGLFVGCYMLIHEGHDTLGGIFGSVAIVLALIALLKGSTRIFGGRNKP